MRISIFIIGLFIQLPLSLHFLQSSPKEDSIQQSITPKIIHQPLVSPEPAANLVYKYISFIRNKKLGLVVNHTSRIKHKHLVDSLLNRGCNIQKIFAPEHGFRGNADAGEKVKDGVDTRTGIPIVSLYGKNKKPTAEQVKGLDLMIFDIQDVGARFYTYTSTMTYIMEICAQENIPLLILDRPNPNGHYVDGPVLEKAFKSFVGLHPVPIVHGLTTAEYARMINGEYWLADSLQCNLYHVECANYSHRDFYQLPINPSPNLPNMHSIYLYPSLCLFEPTTASVGRGTNKQFQIYGQPKVNIDKGFNFTPIPRPGAKRPKHKNQLCTGYNLSTTPLKQLQGQKQLTLSYLFDFYKQLPAEAKKDFFKSSNFFNKLAGNSQLQEQLKKGIPLSQVRQSWEPALSEYKKLRKKYLLYPDYD